MDPYKQERFESHFVLLQAAALLSRRVLMMEVGHRLGGGRDEERCISQCSGHTQFVWPRILRLLAVIIKFPRMSTGTVTQE